ncbi:MAG: DUF2089 domain-containing protein [Egibacteraceae bacterium]
MSVTPDYRPPTRCPVCSDTLVVTRLQCPRCATELSGQFSSCEFCALSPEQRELLGVFLASRGNLKEIERHLGVSYPTARARVAELLTALGLDEPKPDPRLALLESLARGEVDVDEALGRLG